MNAGMPGRTSVVVVLALAAGAASGAEQVAAPAIPNQADNMTSAPTLQVVEIKGSAGSYEARRDDTAARIVLTRDELLKYGDANVVESLKRVSGVTVISTARGNQISMRGLGAGYTQILLNGDRTPLGFSLDSISPADIERIEVYRSATAELSTESIAGTINIILRKSVKQAQREIQAGYGGGKAEQTARGNFQISDRDGKFSYSLSGTSRNTRIDRQSPVVDEAINLASRTTSYQNTAAHDTGNFDVFNIVPRLNWTLENGDSLSLQNFFSVTRFDFRSVQSTTSVNDAPPRYPQMDSHIKTENRMAKSDLLWAHKFEGGGKFDLKVGLQVAGIDRDADRLADTVAVTVPLLDSHADSRISDKIYSTTGKYATSAGDGHMLVFGWDASQAKRNENGSQHDNTFSGAGTVNFDDVINSSVSKFALFGQDEWTVSPALSVYMGMRWQGIRIHTEGESFADSHTQVNVVSPILQTLYKFPQSRGDQLRFALTRTYKAPESADLIPLLRTQEINSSTNPDTRGNRFLKPELALGFDIGYEHYWDKNALVSMTLSSRKISDYTMIVVEQEDNGRWVASPRNNGKAETRSLELEAKFPLKTVAATAPPMDLRASVSRNWSSVDEVPGPENRIRQQIPVSATLSVDYVYGALTTGASYVFNTAGWSRPSLTQRNYGSVRRDLDFYGVWKFSATRQLRVSMGNLLRQDTRTATTYESTSSVATRSTVVREYPTIRALIEMKL